MTLFERILTARGLTTRAAREAFLQPDYAAVKHNPFLLPGHGEGGGAVETGAAAR